MRAAYLALFATLALLSAPGAAAVRGATSAPRDVALTIDELAIPDGARTIHPRTESATVRVRLVPFVPTASPILIAPPPVRAGHTPEPQVTPSAPAPIAPRSRAPPATTTRSSQSVS